METPQRRASDNGGPPNPGRRESDLAVVVQKIIESMPDESLDKHDYHHDELEKRLAMEREAKEYWSRLKKQAFEDFLKWAIGGVAVALFSIFVLGMNAKFAELVNKAVDAPKASSK